MYFHLIFSLFFSVALTHFVIKIATLKKLFDFPDENRKIHSDPISNIGGVAVYFTIILSFFTFYSDVFFTTGLKYLFTSITLIFLFGLKDDLVGLSPLYRFIGQILSGLIMIILGDFRIYEIELLGINQLNYETSIVISLFVFVFLVNAFNLIDGINGLLGSISLFSSLYFSFLFDFEKSLVYLYFSELLATCSLGFLFFNFGKAKIFMGSCGSYLIGTMMYFLTIGILHLNSPTVIEMPRFSILLSILIIPIYDSARVILLRVIKGKSPFSADSNHIHHRLLRLNFSHTQVVLLLILTQFLIIVFNLLNPSFFDLSLIFIDFLILIILNIILELRIKKLNNCI
jgi:UDP-GlcNAc:undecaprenyl-phosphate GlcNAc-1-phosphate transferase